MAEEQIGKYRILGELGKGSMGVVYRGEDPEIGRLVAIKTLRSVYLSADAAGQEALQRFKQEARSAGKLKHPNIVTIFETGRTDSGSPFIVMELIEGESLEDKLVPGKPLEPLETIHLLAQIASAIDYAHGHSIVHRDIKPSNVIINSDLKPQLLDFGVAKLSDTSLTPAGTVVGTPSYMAPEQIRGETLDGATDRFAFAVLAYEMLTGSRPFPGHDFMTVVSNIIHQEPISFEKLGNPADPAFEPVLRKGMNKDKNDRFASCLEFVRELAAPFGLTVDHNGVLGFRKGITLKDLQGPIPPPPKSVSLDETTATVMGAIVPEEVKDSKETAARSDTPPAPPMPPKISAQKFESEIPMAKEGGRPGVFILVVFVLLGLMGLIGYMLVKQQRESEKLVEEETVTTTTLAEAVSIIPTQEPISVTPEPTPGCLLTEGCSIVTTPTADLSVSLLSQLTDTNISDDALIAAISQAGSLDYGISAPVLLSLSKHPNFKVRIAVLKLFTSSDKFRTREVFRAIVERLNDQEFLVRGFTAKFLGSLDNDAARKLLQAHLGEEKDPTVKKVIEDILKEN